jgi:hypothetical protein
MVELLPEQCLPTYHLGQSACCYWSIDRTYRVHGRSFFLWETKTFDSYLLTLVCTQEDVGETSSSVRIAIIPDVDPLDKQVLRQNSAVGRELHEHHDDPSPHLVMYASP